MGKRGDAGERGNNKGDEKGGERKGEVREVEQSVREIGG